MKKESTEKEKEVRKFEKRYMSSSFVTMPIGILTAPTSCFAMVKGLQNIATKDRNGTNDTRGCFDICACVTVTLLHNGG